MWFHDEFSNRRSKPQHKLATDDDDDDEQFAVGVPLAEGVTRLLSVQLFQQKHSTSTLLFFYLSIFFA